MISIFMRKYKLTIYTVKDMRGFIVISDIKFVSKLKAVRHSQSIS